MSARERLYQIQTRTEAARVAPWDVDSRADDYWAGVTDTNGDALFIGDSMGDGITHTADAVFVAHAREDVPALVAALRAVLNLGSDWESHASRVEDVYGRQVVSVEFAVTQIRKAIEEALR